MCMCMPLNVHKYLELYKLEQTRMTDITNPLFTEDIDLEFDKNYVWHPYTSMVKPLTCYPVDSASGAIIKLSNGSELVDGMSSWWCAIHGYSHPLMNKAAIDQIGKMSHIMFGGITHRPAVELCKKLKQMTDESLECVFLADGGSAAVEVSLKLALSYWKTKNVAEKTKFLSIKNGFHGDSAGALSVCDPTNAKHALYKGYLANNIFAESPKIGFNDSWDEQDISSFQSLIEEHANCIAGVILEPVVQGAGGMRIYHPTYVKRVRELCNKYGVLLIMDEVAVGFGRTGKMFAHEHAGVVPDILCLGKGLTGGYMTLAAVLMTREIALNVSQAASGPFMHGQTFMGNPLACALGNQSLEILSTGEWKSQVKRIEQQLIRELKEPLELQRNENVADVRVLGAIAVVELTHPVNPAKLQAEFVKMGVWIRPFGKLIYILPPYVITQGYLSKLIAAILVAVDL